MTEMSFHNGFQKPATVQQGMRLRVVQIAILVLFAAVCCRLGQIQIIQSQKYRSLAQKQYQAKFILPAPRGNLFDRNGNSIASNTTSVSFAADPQGAGDDARTIAENFSNLFGKQRKFYFDKLQSDSRFVWLERGADASMINKIDLKKLPGIVVRNESKRLYYHDHIAGQLIGMTDVDNKGVAGVELAFDKELSGRDGYVMFQRDGLGRARPSVDYPRVEPESGHNVMLTIDMGIQAVAEKELKKGIVENKADGGIVVILQPKTGEVLAIAQQPEIDPIDFGKYKLEDQKLRAITDAFEPGSVFKIVTASAALENGLVTPARKFYAENGLYVVAGRPKPIEDTHKEGWITFQQAMEVSSNIVMAKVSDLIGSERLFRMARDYGFGVPTNIDFPGEARGVLRKPSEWHGTTTLNSIAFGYEVGVTPMQIASAYAAIANGGVLMQPYIFKKEYDAAGKIIREGKQQQVRRVVSPQTAATMRDLFEGVVLRGTGKIAAIPGIRIAGKTGTSKKYVEGQYETGSYTASFVGFFPVEDPQIVCLVMMDNPRAGNYTGGTTSAPIFRAIAEQLLNTSDVFASPAPTVVASSAVPQQNTGNMFDPSSTKEQNTMISVAGTVPNVKGCSVRRAVNILTTGKFEPVISGSGTVIDQQPAPGEPAKAGMKVRLICQPKTSAALIN